MILSMSIVLILLLLKVNGDDDESESEVSRYRTDPGILEDASLETFALVRKYGYPCEIHRVYTEDGYILEIHRIPHGRNNATDPGPRPVVFMQHGLLSSSAEWVLMMPGKGFAEGTNIGPSLSTQFILGSSGNLAHLQEHNTTYLISKISWSPIGSNMDVPTIDPAYILADAGYDVWMGNARGNTYSKRHVSIKPTSASFWKFSWHEIGYYDLPAMIDYVISNTGVPKLQYVGFSQGTTAFWVMASTRPEYNEKVSAMQALAPVAYVGNIRSPLIKAIAPLTNSLELIMKIIGANEFLPNGKINELAGQIFCLEESITQVICTNLLFLICGFDDAQLNATMLPIVLGHTPAGAATRQFIHYGQLYKSSKFVQFDHGLLTNKRKYGTFKPPPYDLSNIRTPVFLHYADNDWLSTPSDVDKLLKEVKSAVGKYKVPLPKFNHLDFVFATDAKKLIYDRVMKIMERFV